ncbi:MAG: hypothetical protein JW850_14375 [Thermoflexales bacterium]|nr:hypothetical protein [Thermoflexales bacterium]
MKEDHAIQVHYGTLALQFGIGSVPNLFLRFYRHLVHTPQDGRQPMRLSDTEAMLLVHVMALRSDHDFVLRLSNLPMATSLRKREDYLGKFRKMGLIFTSRIYYSRDEMIAYYGPGNLPDSPRMKAQQWDLGSLIHNLSLVAQDYLVQQRHAVEAWKQTGEMGPRPVTELPSDYQHEIVLPQEVVTNIANGIYYPVPGNWSTYTAVPAQIVLVRGDAAVPARKGPVQDAVPAQKAPVQDPYQHEKRRSSMLTPNGVNTFFESEPPSGSLDAELALLTSDTPDSRQECDADTSGVPGNGDLKRAMPVARVLDGAADRGATGDLPASKGSLDIEPLPVRRERVFDDLRTHSSDRRTQIYITAVNIGKIMGMRWENGQLRVHPIKADKAEIGKMCRDHGGPANVWRVACSVAGHEISGDPLDYLWGTLRKQSHAAQAQTFEDVPYTRSEN